MDIKLQLSEIGLNELLKDKFGVSYFSRKIIRQLAGHTNPIKLNEKTANLKADKPYTIEDNCLKTELSAGETAELYNR